MDFKSWKARRRFFVPKASLSSFHQLRICIRLHTMCESLGFVEECQRMPFGIPEGRAIWKYGASLQGEPDLRGDQDIRFVGITMEKFDFLYDRFSVRAQTHERARRRIEASGESGGSNESH